jgi:hypothetical protein
VRRAGPARRRRQRARDRGCGRSTRRGDRTVTVTTRVEAIDKQAGTITLETADGEVRTLEAQNPANLDKVKVGDLLDITYSKALAISVEKPTAR